MVDIRTYHVRLSLTTGFASDVDVPVAFAVVAGAPSFVGVPGAAGAAFLTSYVESAFLFIHHLHPIISFHSRHFPFPSRHTNYVPYSNL